MTTKARILAKSKAQAKTKPRKETAQTALERGNYLPVGAMPKSEFLKRVNVEQRRAYLSGMLTRSLEIIAGMSTREALKHAD